MVLILETWYKNSWKEFIDLKNIDHEFYGLSYYDINVNKYGVKCGTSLDDKRQINRCKKIVDM